MHEQLSSLGTSKMFYMKIELYVIKYIYNFLLIKFIKNVQTFSLIEW